jgi:hypothetical protein
VALKPYHHGHGGATSATLLQTGADGVQYGAQAQVDGSSAFNLKTCDNLAWRPEWHVPHGVPQPISSAIAIINVGGQLLFAATVEAFCVARSLVNVLTLPIATATAVLDGLSLIGAGNLIATYALPAGQSTLTVHFTEAEAELRLNAHGFVSATGQDGATCTALLGACTLRPAGGFAAGSFYNLNVNADSLLPKNVYLSVPR